MHMKVKLNNVGVIKDCEVEFVTGLNLIVGSSGSGKSTLIRSIYNTACNNFNDSDISFDKQSMNITIENDKNTIEYSRQLRKPCSTCSYKVNGEKYVKLGRQALPAVANVLKIGDICINGDDINFNFNLQFSTPFLIMGSQSTLYNVLTYRSTCDITSINEYYESDVKANAAEICSTTKLKEQLNDNLDLLKLDAEKLEPIEDLYCRFINYKHENEKLNDLITYSNTLNNNSQLCDKLNYICTLITYIESAINDLSLLIDLNRFNYIKNKCDKLDIAISKHNNIISDYNKFNINYEQLILLNKLLNIISEYSDINIKCNKLSSLTDKSCALFKYNNFITDIAKLYNLFIYISKCLNKYNILNNANSDIINIISELFIANKKINDINIVTTAISNISSECDTIVNDLNKFEVCPLCGKHLMHND